MVECYPKFDNEKTVDEQVKRLYEVTLLLYTANWERYGERTVYVSAVGFDEAVRKAKEYWEGRELSGTTWSGSSNRVISADVKYVKFCEDKQFLI